MTEIPEFHLKRKVSFLIIWTLQAPWVSCSMGYDIVTDMGNDYNKTLTWDIIGLQKIESISIFRYLSSKNMRILPIFGLDFSQANLTFDDDICLHRTKEDKPKVYLKILSKFFSVFYPICTDYSIPYAFGWKAMPGTSTSDWLALSGDYFKPEVKMKNLKGK